MEKPLIRSGINPANIGYLPALVLKELAMGRSCEITGGLVATIKTHEDYKTREYRLMGKFGEVVARRQDGTALIATRSPPEWAEKKIHSIIWDCEEMARWFIPVEQR